MDSPKEKFYIFQNQAPEDPSVWDNERVFYRISPKTQYRPKNLFVKKRISL